MRRDISTANQNCCAAFDCKISANECDDSIDNPKEYKERRRVHIRCAQEDIMISHSKLYADYYMQLIHSKVRIDNVAFTCAMCNLAQQNDAVEL